MRNSLLILSLLTAVSSVSAQVTPSQSIRLVTTAPSGSCVAGLPNQQVLSTGTQYSCQSVVSGVGTWGAIGGGGGGTPGGTTGSIQYNNAGAFGGLSGTGVIYGNGSSAPTVVGTTGSGNFVRTTAPTITSIILNGSPSGTGVSQTGGPGTLAQRDGSNNLVANNFLASATVVSSAGGTTTLTVGSSRYQFLTGTTTQTFQLPSATTVTVGTSFWFNNNSTGTMTINDGSGALLATVQYLGMVNVVLQVAGTTAGTWDVHPLTPSNVSWTSAGGLAQAGIFGQSASTGASIPATTLVSSVPSNPGMYSLHWTISLTAAGVGCTGPTVVVFQDVFTDPSASTSNTVTIATATLASNGNGTPGYIIDGVATITAKTATAIQYQTTYTEGAGCTTAPTYQISYTITQLH